MKKLIALAALLFSAASFAQVTVIQRNELGAGQPGHEVGSKQAFPVLENDIYHVPQYMPNFPTAATIWPRIIDVQCTQVGVNVQCDDGYQWQPSYGRGEYLFFRTVFKDPVPPVEKPVPVYVPYPVYVEAKPKKE